MNNHMSNRVPTPFLQPKRILCLFAHPDDETFGPGGSLAVWKGQGAEVHIICATKGEAGGNPTARVKEIKDAAKILDFNSVTFLKFKDGKIGNSHLLELENAFIPFINKLKPDTIVTFDLNGVSGHLDHIAVASAATQAFKKTKVANQLLYYCISERLSKLMDHYFIHFPQGKRREHVDLIVDIAPVWQKRVKAMYAHQSQIKDVIQILARRKLVNAPKEEWFMIRTR